MKHKFLVAALVLVSPAFLTSCGSSDSPAAPQAEADLVASPTSGTVITDFRFDASGSSVNGRAFQFRWDWENDGTWDTDWSTEPTTTRRFDSAEEITVAVQVDAGESRDAASVDITLDLDHGSVEGFLATPLQVLSAIAYGDDSLWLTNWVGWPCTVFRVDPATGDSIRTFDSPSNWPCGIAWDGTSLWISDFSGGMKMFEIDPTDGSVLSSFPIAYSYAPAGLAWDGEYLYHGCYHDAGSAGSGVVRVGGDAAERDNGDGRIRKYARDGTYAGVFDSPRGSLVPHGIAFDGEDLWVTLADRDTLYRVDREDGSVLGTVPISIGTGRIATDESLFWLAHSWTGELVRIVP